MGVQGVQGGLSTQPRGDPVLSVGGEEQRGNTLTVCGWSVRKSLIQAQVEGESYVSQLIHQDVRGG